MTTKTLIYGAFYGIFGDIKSKKIKSFGDNLKEARTKKGIWQGQLAELMQIHSAHISRYERNQTVPSVEVVKKFANILEVSADMLIYGTEDEKAKSKITDTKLLNMFSKAQQLNDHDLDCIKSLIKAFLFLKDMQKQLEGQ
jgi:transcriptional regulator with XRE-family HTH domain